MNEFERLDLIAKAIKLYKSQLEHFPTDSEFLLIFIEAQIKNIRQGK